MPMTPPPGAQVWPSDPCSVGGAGLRAEFSTSAPTAQDL